MFKVEKYVAEGGNTQSKRCIACLRERGSKGNVLRYAINNQMLQNKGNLRESASFVGKGVLRYEINNQMLQPHTCGLKESVSFDGDIKAISIEGPLFAEKKDDGLGAVERFNVLSGQSDIKENNKTMDLGEQSSATGPKKKPVKFTAASTGGKILIGLCVALAITVVVLVVKKKKK